MTIRSAPMIVFWLPATDRSTSTKYKVVGIYHDGRLYEYVPENGLSVQGIERVEFPSFLAAKCRQIQGPKHANFSKSDIFEDSAAFVASALGIPDPGPWTPDRLDEYFRDIPAGTFYECLRT